MSGFASRTLLFEWAFVCLGTAASSAQTPSFDCARAHLPDEVAICQTQELARLEGVVAAAYSYLKSTRGRSFADQIGIPFWRARQACQYDVDCIRARQMEEIAAFRAAGVPISPFDSSPSQQPFDSQYDAATELRQCVNEKDPNEKIDHCSRVIGQSRGIAALITAHNTRGLALMEVGRFAEAAQDFTFVIRYEPRVAGFYDNRQNAYRRSGQFDLALLAPTWRSNSLRLIHSCIEVERMSTMIWENWISRSRIITKRLNLRPKMAAYSSIGEKYTEDRPISIRRSPTFPTPSSWTRNGLPRSENEV